MTNTVPDVVCSLCNGLRSVPDPKYPGKATFIDCPACHGTGRTRVRVKEQRTLASAWAEFEGRVLDPINASQIQRKMMRRAFYAGADIFWTMVITGLDPGMEDTPSDTAYLDSLHEEIRVFIDQLSRGEV